jgi:molybdenum cofactor sulfurtransferase
MYLDHAGSAVPDKKVLKKIYSFLSSNNLTNPHSSSSSNYVENCRKLILTLCNTTEDEYTVIFTSNATHAIKLVGETLGFTDFLYTKTNHNSVVGLRSYAIQKGASISVLDNNLNVISNLKTRPETGASLKLYAFPAECNFSGIAFDLDMIERVHADPNALVLLDAAKFIATNRLDLTKYKPDFVPMSLYKIVGYPTGLGALLVRNTCRQYLSKTYFGGGTYDINIADTLYSKPREKFTEQFEDGTLPFSNIAAAGIALEYYLENDLDSKISNCHTVTSYALEKLQKLHHENGQKLVHIYNYNTSSIVTFNLMNKWGAFIGYKDVEMFANASPNGIKLRTGCCCNPGSCATLLGHTTEDIVRFNSLGHKCWDQKDLIDGRPTGAVRISFGLSSTFADVDNFVAWLKQTFIVADVVLDSNIPMSPFASSFWIYPIKSCPGISADKWTITPSGFKYDRMFAIYDDKNKLIGIQRNPKLSTIQPQIRDSVLTLVHTESEEEINIMMDEYDNSKVADYVCNQWLSDKLGQSATLIKCGDTNFSNSSPFLFLNMQSLHDLNQRIFSKQKWSGLVNMLPEMYGLKDAIKSTIFEEMDVDRFRPNIVLDGLRPYEEDDIKELTIGHAKFVAESQCSRCYTTTMNSKRKERDHALEPMKTLLTYRKRGEGTMFGVYFMLEFGEEERILTVDDIVSITK